MFVSCAWTFTGRVNGSETADMVSFDATKIFAPFVTDMELFSVFHYGANLAVSGPMYSHNNIFECAGSVIS
jgi:hypothetical protein